MSRYLKTRAVVLSSRPLGEADRIVSLFSKTDGRIDGVVKGVRRTKSRWGGRLEPFGVVDLVLFRGRSLYTVTSAQLVSVFTHLRDDREAVTVAGIACEAAAGLFGEEEEHVNVFTLLARLLFEADVGFEGRAAEAPLALGALLKILSEAGYMPVMGHCAACGGGGLAVGFSAARGGLVCTECAHEGVAITPGAQESLRRALSEPLGALRSDPPSPGVTEALRHAGALYAYHTGTRLRTLRSLTE
jgi:DNA repair protein RecO (recombination protein O)